MNTYNMLNGHGPRDLREYLPTAGRIYPVDPAAVERFKRITAEREAETDRRRQAMAISRSGQKPIKKQKTAVFNQTPKKEVPMIDTSLYPPEVVKAAAAELEKSPTGRRFKKVFTAEVAAVWRDMLKQGKTIGWIADFNGLAPTSPETVKAVLNKYSDTASQPKPKPTQLPDTQKPNLNGKPTTEDNPITTSPPVVPEPAPVNENARPFIPDLPDFFRRDYLPPVQVAKPAAGLDTLIELLRDEHVEIEGEVNLNLTIRINKRNKNE